MSIFNSNLTTFRSNITCSRLCRTFRGVEALAGLGDGGTEAVGRSEHERSIFLRILTTDTLRIARAVDRHRERVPCAREMQMKHSDTFNCSELLGHYHDSH